MLPRVVPQTKLEVLSESPASSPDEGSDDPYTILGFDTRAPSPGLSVGARGRTRDVAEALFSTDDGPPDPSRLDWVERDLADFFGHATGRAALTFRACLFCVTWLAPLVIFRLPPLGRLPVPTRVHALERFEQLPVAVLTVLAVKAIISLVYYEHPDAAREIGWDQACMGRQPKR